MYSIYIYISIGLPPKGRKKHQNKIQDNGNRVIRTVYESDVIELKSRGKKEKDTERREPREINHKIILISTFGYKQI